MAEHSVRVRFAPSPTGLLHIGGLRTALYNYLFSKKNDGTFILRIEDTDQTRFVAEAESDIVDSLRWAGLHFDEGPGVDGLHMPYRQSERQELYRNHAQRLLDAGLAYYAFDTEEEIDAMRQRLRQAGNVAPKYDAVTRMEMKNALTLSEGEVRRRLEMGESHVIRMKVPTGESLRIHDLIRGWVSFDTSDVDDQVLVKSDGMPTYHLASVVDDHLMEVTHVIRGEEWLPSTPKHFLLYRFFGWQPPSVAHLPLILSPKGGKLSKRNADELGIPVSVRQYRDAGYEPQALLNFLAFLGWNPGTEQEVFTLDELGQAFSIDRVGSGSVQFNLDKLRWYNQQFIRRLSPQELADRALPYLQARGFHPDGAYLVRVAALMQERLVFVGDLATTGSYFFEDPEAYDPDGVKKRWKEGTGDLLSAYANRLEKLESFGAAKAEEALRSLSEEREVGGGKIIHPVRLALSGVTAGPGLFDMMDVLGSDTCIRRIRHAVQTLG